MYRRHHKRSWTTHWLWRSRSVSYEITMNCLILSSWKKVFHRRTKKKWKTSWSLFEARNFSYLIFPWFAPFYLLFSTLTNTVTLQCQHIQETTNFLRLRSFQNTTDCQISLSQWNYSFPLLFSLIPFLLLFFSSIIFFRSTLMRVRRPNIWWPTSILCSRFKISAIFLDR